MKPQTLIVIPIALILLTAGCSSHEKYHRSDLPDPTAFNAHFGDMDTNGDELVNWEEFAVHFPNADRQVFNAVDLNKDDKLDHDEWHAFKTAHGLTHHD